jgi:hypothetical protein
MYAESKSERTSSGLMRPWYVVSARSSTSITSSDRAPFGVAAAADAGGFGVAAASADHAVAQVTRAITDNIVSYSAERLSDQ